MQLEDHRHTTHTLEFDELTSKEQDEYAIWMAYMCKYRSCSACGVTFSLRHSLADGTSCPGACRANRPRDHIDYNTEVLDRLDKIDVPYRIYLVLKSQNLWPEHRYMEHCTKQRMSENNTRLPESVTVHRTMFKRGALDRPILCHKEDE